MSMKTISFIYNNQEYKVNITYKMIKNIYYRYKDGEFYISTRLMTSDKKILKGLEKFAPTLIKRGDNKPFDDSFFYYLGKKYPLTNSGVLPLSDGTTIEYKSKDDLLKKLKPIFLNIIKNRVTYYEKIMNVPSYKVGVRDTSTRWGSNSKRTKSLSFSLQLIHYSIEIIDSVIVHELSHILVYNHSKDFYDVVYKYCPNYKTCHTKLRKRIYC